MTRAREIRELVICESDDNSTRDRSDEKTKTSTCDLNGSLYSSYILVLKCWAAVQWKLVFDLKDVNIAAINIERRTNPICNEHGHAHLNVFGHGCSLLIFKIK